MTTINPTPEHRQELRALFDEVLGTAMNDSHACQNEYSCSDEHDEQYAAERAKIEELQAAFPAFLDHIDRLEAALDRQCDNMAFVVNHVELHDWYDKFKSELEEDRLALNQEQEQGNG